MRCTECGKTLYPRDTIMFDDHGDPHHHDCYRARFDSCVKCGGEYEHEWLVEHPDGFVCIHCIREAVETHQLRLDF